MRSNGPDAASSARDRLGDRGHGRLGVELAAVGLQMDGARDAHRHRVAQLLERLGRAERQHDGLAAVRLDEADRLLDAALLVRADREPEVLRLERLLVGGQHHLAAGQGNALHADQDLHQDRILRFSGSKTGRGPTTSTVTGKALGHVFHRELLRTLDGVLGRQVGEQDVAAERRAGTGAGDVRPAALGVGDRRAVAQHDRLAAERVALARRDADVWSSMVSVQRMAAGSASRWRRCASLPMKSCSLTRTACMPASTTSYSVSSSAPYAR